MLKNLFFIFILIIYGYKHADCKGYENSLKVKKNLIKNKKLLITGGAGFIGSNLAEILQDKYEVTILDNLSNGKLDNIKNLKVKFVNGDIRNSKLLEKIISKMDYVVHLAANVSVPKSLEDPYFSQSVNIAGFVNVIEACKKFKIKKLVYASSAAVYGDNQNLPLNENENFRPLSPYGLEKAVDEQYAILYRQYVDSIGLRFFNVYGKNQDPKSPYSGVISIFMNAFKEDKDIKIFGDGLQTRDLINVEDVCDAIEKSLNSQYSGVLNICTGKATNLIKVIEILHNVSGKNKKINFYPARQGDIKHSVCDNKKAQKEIGFLYKIDISEGLKELFNIT